LEDRGRMTPLSYAALWGHDDVVKELLERGNANPDLTDEDDRTPLSFAAQYGSEDVVKILLARGDVNPHSPDADDRTPLSYAAECGHEGVFKILLEQGDANPDLPDENGRTPLSFAAECGCEAVVKILLARGDVNPNLPDKKSRTPLSFAAEYGREGVVKILLERGDVNPDLPDTKGQIPLSFANKYGREGVVKILLERGDANRGSSDRWDCTLFSHPSQARQGSLTRLLESHPLQYADPESNNKTQPISPSPPEEAGLGPIRLLGSIISNTRQDITEAIHLTPPEKSSANQAESPRSPPIYTPTAISDTAPNISTPIPSRSLKRDRATPPSLPPSKRKRFPSY